VEGFRERQTYEVEAPSGPDGAVRPSLQREDRRRSALSFADWIGVDLRLEVGAALDKWSGRGSYVSFESKLDVRLADDRLALGAELAQWTSLERGAPFQSGGLLAQWSTKHLENGGWQARIGVSRATAEAPLALWPGAGTGHGREPLLRAHPLLVDGVVAGRAFGRTLFYTGLERQSWTCAVGSLRLGWILYVDGAKPWDPLSSAGVPFQVDGGAGVRIAGWGTRGEFRITAGHGFEDGRSALSVSWEVR
jgi:hypothetical protein